MDTDNTNEKLQSRREFFKKAAKSVLPILGAIALSHVPTILKAEPKTPMGCDYSCWNACGDSVCQGTCIGGCYNTCNDSCRNTCTAYCNGDCTAWCANACSGLCQSACTRGCAAYVPIFFW